MVIKGETKPNPGKKLALTLTSLPRVNKVAGTKGEQRQAPLVTIILIFLMTIYMLLPAWRFSSPGKPFVSTLSSEAMKPPPLEYRDIFSSKTLFLLPKCSVQTISNMHIHFSLFLFAIVGWHRCNDSLKENLNTSNRDFVKLYVPAHALPVFPTHPYKWKLDFSLITKSRL